MPDYRGVEHRTRPAPAPDHDAGREDDRAGRAAARVRRAGDRDGLGHAQHRRRRSATRTSASSRTASVPAGLDRGLLPGADRGHRRACCSTPATALAPACTRPTARRRRSTTATRGSAYLAAIGDVASAFPVAVVEYFNASQGHYFMTADADEIALPRRRRLRRRLRPHRRDVPRARRSRAGHERRLPLLHRRLRAARLALLHELRLRVRPREDEPELAVREARLLRQDAGRRRLPRRAPGLPRLQQRADRRAEPPLHDEPRDLRRLREQPRLGGRRRACSAPRFPV